MIVYCALWIRVNVDRKVSSMIMIEPAYTLNI